MSAIFQHLQKAIVAEVSARPRPGGAPVRILDAGCGDGALIAYLHKGLAAELPGVPIEIYGFDVSDHGVQTDGYLARAVAGLNETAPGAPWAERIAAIAIGEPWPYADGYFDAVVSNQVLEHVDDAEAFFAEIKRTLKNGGFSVHLFPPKDNWFDFHLRLLFVHWIENYDLRRGYIRFCSKLGMGKYPGIRKGRGTPLEEYVEAHTDYIQHWTCHRNTVDFLRLAKKYSMRGSFRYTHEYYKTRLARGASTPPYSRDRSALADFFALALWRRLASVTLFLEKSNVYAIK